MINKRYQNKLLLWLYLLTNIFYVNKIKANEKTNELLIQSIRTNDSLTLKKILSLKKININKKDDLGNTAIHYAVMFDRKETVKLLLDKKANFLIPNSYGKSAKQIATDKNNEEILEIFRLRIKKNRESSDSFKEIYKRITKEKIHCCQFYGQLKKNNYIKVLIQKTMPNGDCSLNDYNPPHQNLMSGDCNLNKTYEGCRGHTQQPGACKTECGWEDKGSCSFLKTFQDS